LHVDAIVEGTVFRSGEQVRISALLVDASTDQHVWAQSYERDLRDILTLQKEVAADWPASSAPNCYPETSLVQSIRGPMKPTCAADTT